MKGRKFTVIKGGLNTENPWARRKRQLLHLGLVLGLTGIALIMMGRAGSFLTRAMISQAIVRLEPIDTQIPFRGLILKTEYLVAAPSDGIFAPGIDTGTRVRVGQSLGTLEGPSGSVDFSSHQAGLFVVALDGLEQDFPCRDRPDTGLAVAVARILDNPPLAKAVSSVDAGRPVAVIIGNSYIQLLGRLASLPTGNSHLLQFQDGDVIYQRTGQVKGIIAYDGYYWVLWELTNFPEALSVGRVLEGQAVLPLSNRAARLPTGALVWKENSPGVLRQTRNGPVFQEVDLLHKGLDEIWVEGLSEGVQVVVFSRVAGIIKWWWLR